jgi:predicted O-methyltransferase YrrM
MLARAINATTIIEFGTSFGVSTLHLAAALRDNGGGKLITSEFEPTKIARARANIAAGGLADLVEIREGDALQTLAQDLPESIDLLLLDGAKGLYLDILSLVEQRLRVGTLIVADNAEWSPTIWRVSARRTRATCRSPLPKISNCRCGYRHRKRVQTARRENRQPVTRETLNNAPSQSKTAFLEAFDAPFQQSGRGGGQALLLDAEYASRETIDRRSSWHLTMFVLHYSPMTFTITRLSRCPSNSA